MAALSIRAFVRHYALQKVFYLVLSDGFVEVFWISKVCGTYSKVFYIEQVVNRRCFIERYLY